MTGWRGSGEPSDVEDRALAEVLAELRETEARQRALLAVLPDLMFRLHRDGTYLEFAGDLTRLATPAEELRGSNIHDILPADVAGALMGCAQEALRSRSLRTVEYRLRTLAGDVRDFEARVVPSAADEVVTIVRDVTDAKVAEQELRESRARIVEAGDAERRRLERNLHDGAQQRLVTLNLSLHLAERELAQDPASARRFLRVAQEELAAALAELRQLAQGLHPPVLGSEGLGGAVRALVERSAVPVQIDDIPAQRLPEAVEATAYYVIAELIANAGKHANSTRIAVSARVDGDELVVDVADDGVGGADVAAGTGLRGLADRVEAAGGRLEIQSPAGGGTRARAVIPSGARP